jgi:hypothetical protein
MAQTAAGRKAVSAFDFRRLLRNGPLGSRRLALRFATESSAKVSEPPALYRVRAVGTKTRPGIGRAGARTSLEIPGHRRRNHGDECRREERAASAADAKGKPQGAEHPEPGQ